MGSKLASTRSTRRRTSLVAASKSTGTRGGDGSPLWPRPSIKPSAHFSESRAPRGRTKGAPWKPARKPPRATPGDHFHGFGHAQKPATRHRWPVEHIQVSLGRGIPFAYPYGCAVPLLTSMGRRRAGSVFQALGQPAIGGIGCNRSLRKGEQDQPPRSNPSPHRTGAYEPQAVKT